MKKIIRFTVIAAFFFLCARLTAQNSHKKETLLQSNLATAEQQLQQGDRSGALKTYNLVRETGGMHPLSLVANDSIAWMSFDDGDIAGMYKSILFYDKYLSKYPYDNTIKNENELLKEYYYKLKNSLSISGDLCGIWVSDYSEDENRSPYFILEITKNDNDEYEAHVHSSCHVADKYPTYHHQKYKYKAKELAKAPCEITWEQDSLYVRFAEKKFINGCPSCAHIMSSAGISIMQSANTLYNNVTSDPYFYRSAPNIQAEVLTTVLTATFVGATISLLAILIAESKTYAYSIESDLSYITRGCMECTLTEHKLAISTNGRKEDKYKSLRFNLFKLYPDDEIRFIGYNNELVGNHKFTKKEAKEHPEYKFKKDSILAYNTTSYKNLINEFSSSHGDMSEDDKSNIIQSFSDASSGDNYGVIPTSYGYYYGKVKDGIPLEEPTHHKFIHNNIVSDFFGVVKNGRREGEGINYAYSVLDSTSNLFKITKGTWEDGDLSGYVEMWNLNQHTLFKGLYKDDHREGEGVLIDSIHNIQWIGSWSVLFGGYENLAGTVEERDLDGGLIYRGEYWYGKRHGQGIEYSPNGNKYEGYWRHGEKHKEGISYISDENGNVQRYNEVWKKGKLVKQEKYED